MSCRSCKAKDSISRYDVYREHDEQRCFYNDLNRWKYKKVYCDKVREYLLLHAHKSMCKFCTLTDIYTDLCDDCFDLEIYNLNELNI